MTTSSTRITPLPAAKMPREMVATRPCEMEPNERQYVRPCAIFVDVNERVWLDAEATCLPSCVDEVKTGNALRIKRTEEGVELQLRAGWVWPKCAQCPFEVVLPVTKIVIMSDDD